jgi:crossover junction endodeoxyribonuclease RusA
LWVPGVPVPQGSKTAFVRGPRAVLVDANAGKLKPWRSHVSSFALDAWGGQAPLDEDVIGWIEFIFPRPAAHFGSGKNAAVLKPSAPFYKNTKPDRDKLERAIYDALTDAGVLRDDCRVVEGGSRKVYGPKPGARVHIQTREQSA